MIEFSIDNKDCIEVEKYSEDCTVEEYANNLTERINKVNICERCGNCCFDIIPIIGYEIRRIMEIMNIKTISQEFYYLVLPNKPNVAGKNNSIHDLMKTYNLSESIATILYEYNNVEPITMNKNKDGQCLSITDDKCAKYKIRPLICRLYHCNLGNKVSALNELIINQGIWHSYYIMEWIKEKDISHNPFIKGNNLEEVLLKDFDHNFDEIDDTIGYIL
jgi:Fe-S-cluster containining protein